MSTLIAHELVTNRLLGVLREPDRIRLASQMYGFDLQAGFILQAAGEIVEHTWFPCGAAIASFCIESDAGECVEVAMVGREGAVGGIVSNGDTPAFATAKVRASGRFLRIRTTALEAAKLDSIALRHWFARYSDCLLALVFQTAACNARHSILQRASRWMLAAAERTQSPHLAMTQEELAELLGVGRTYINRTFAHLRQHGLIETKRGQIFIVDEKALRLLSCSCTAIVQDHFQAVLEGSY